MMNNCLSYKGKILLKMYPTWNKSETKEIVRLNVKFGNTIPGWKKHPALDEVDLPPKWIAPNQICLETGVMPPPQCRHVKEDICIISSDDDLLLTAHKNKGKQLSLIKLSISRRIFVYNTFPRRSKKSLPKLKLPHHSLVPNLLQICLLQIHNEIWQILVELMWRQRHWPLQRHSQ